MTTTQTFFCLPMIFLLTSCGVSLDEPQITCNDIDVKSTASELALEIIEDGIKQSATEACDSPLAALGIPRCDTLYQEFFGAAFMPESVEVNGVRTLEQDDYGKHSCVASFDFRYEQRDTKQTAFGLLDEALEEEVANAIVQVTERTMGHLFAQLDAARSEVKSVQGEYDVQVTDDGSEYYVNLELEFLPLLEE